MSQELSDFLAQLKARYPAETEFHQAVTEVAKSVWPFIEKNPKYRKANILERHHRAGARDHVSRDLDGPPRRGAGQPRLPRADEQRHRARTRAGCGFIRR